MKKLTIGAILVILLCGLCFSLWYRSELHLADRIPAENWVRCEVFMGKPGVGDTEVPMDDLQGLLDAIGRTTVVRRSEFRGFFTPYFRITLYKGESYPTLIHVAENGDISVAVELDLDHYSYYKGGEELYQAILELTAP